MIAIALSIVAIVLALFAMLCVIGAYREMNDRLRAMEQRRPGRMPVDRREA